MPGLRAILEVGGRHPSPSVLDYEHCFTHGVRVLSCTPAFGPTVAEMALTMALASARGIVDGHKGFLTGDEKYLHEGSVGTFSLYRQTVGFIGFGGLARSLMPLLEPFGCTIQAYDPWLPDSYLSRQGVVPCPLDQLLETSRVIFVLAIPSASNKGLLGRDRLERIGTDSVLVLISRAHLVDFDALTDLVSEGRLKAAIDVFPEEPLPKYHLIRKAPGVILSGHRAANVPNALHAIGRMVVDDLEAMASGLPPTAMQVAHPEIIHRLD
jgi:phosphoglycerate dehydrogenase-like enzyme